MFFKIKNYLCLVMTFFLMMQTASAQGVVDVHSHIILPEYLSFLKENHAELQETFPLPQWNMDEHLQFMTDLGIDYSVLSLPAPQPYFGDKEKSADVVRNLNNLSAKVRDLHPDKFKF